jgi:hypothetical protein
MGAKTTCLAVMLSCACGPAEQGASSPPGSGGESASGGSSASSGGQSASGGVAAASGGAGQGGTTTQGGCSVALSFTTVDNNGQYSPNNVSAVWVTSPSGAFVRTLEENGFIRQFHLTAWEQASGGNTVDAVTGATNRAPRAHQSTWDCTDLNGAPVPAGTYTLNAEFATDNGGFFSRGGPPLLQVPVPVGQGPQSIHPADAQYFTGIAVTVE